MGNEVTMESLVIENAALKAELAEVNQKLSWLMEQVAGHRRKLYGSSSEKGVYSGVQSGLFDEEASEPIVFDISPQSDQMPTKERPRKRGEMSKRLPDDLPVESIECVLPDDKQDCPVCGTHMRVIGKEVARRELKIIPAKAIITEYVRYAYGCRECEKSDTVPTIIKAQLPNPLIKGSMCSPETLAHIAVQKCVMGVPLYRQEQDWRRNGIPIARQTMASWLIRCSQDYLEPLYSELHRRLLRHHFLHSDETSFQVLDEPGKAPQSKSSMWVYRTSGDAEHPVIFYDYQPDKKKERPRDFLKGFSGFLMTDGYSAYHSLPENIIVVGCFAHCRRYFESALKCMKEKDQPGSLAAEGMQFCDTLFDIERKIKDKPFEERYALRNKMAAPVLEEFRAWLDCIRPHVAQKSKLGSAVNYALNQWEYLTRYLLDGRIEISNNRAERSVKPFVINRKNFLFAATVAGARSTAIYHSLTETAKENGLNPYRFLTHILRTLAAGNGNQDHALITALLPENAPTECARHLS
jgi:transposase